MYNPLLPEDTVSELQPVRKKPPRLQSLDVFRGLTIAWMILVDNAGDAFPEIDHCPWNGVALADFVMPWFLFTSRWVWVWFDCAEFFYRLLAAVLLVSLSLGVDSSFFRF